MTIRYVLEKNFLSQETDAYLAKVQPTGMAGLDEIFEQMAKRGISISSQDFERLLEEYAQAIEDLILEGKSINTPLANFNTSIQGIFHSQSDDFDPERHQVHVRITPGERLRASLVKRWVAQKIF